MSAKSLKGIENALYNGALMAIGVLGSRLSLKALGAKDRPIEFKPKSFTMLSGEIATASYVVAKIKEAKLLPDKIFV